MFEHTAEERNSLELEEVLNSAQIGEVEKEFFKHDSDEDGKLDFNEFDKLWKKWLGL